MNSCLNSWTFFKALHRLSLYLPNEVGSSKSLKFVEVNELKKKTEFLHVHHTFWYISWPSLLIQRKHVYGERKHSSERNRYANFLFNPVRGEKNFVNENLYFIFEGQFLFDCRILVEFGKSVSLCFATYYSSAIYHSCRAPRGIK